MKMNLTMQKNKLFEVKEKTKEKEVLNLTSISMDNVNQRKLIFLSLKEPSSNKNYKFASINIKTLIQILISEFGFFIILGLILLISFLIPKYHKAKTFISKKYDDSVKFNPNLDPIILIHTTDLHLSAKYDYRTDGSSIFFLSLCQYKPDLMLLTGDYSNNVDENDEMGKQNLNDWKIYNDTIRTFIDRYKIKVIDVSGNHDQWAIDKYDSKENNFLDYSFIYNRTNIKNESDFFLRKIKLSINNIEINFLLLNDYRYPVYRPPYGLEPHTEKKQLDLLEETITSSEENDLFILTHYHVDRAWLIKSTKGHSYEEIISNNKIYSIFTGHLHPEKVIIIHHGSEGGLEYCTPSAFDYKRAGLITYDNGNLIYNEVHIPYYGKKPMFFLTYPTPVDQISGHHYFDTKKFQIRVISFYDNKNIDLKIKGDINGNMIYDRTLNNGALLYKYEVNNLNEGKYKISIYDDNCLGCDINTEFYVGEKYQGKKELYSEDVIFLLILRFLFIPLFIYLLIIVFPFLPELNLPIVKKIEKNIEGQNIIVVHKVNKILLYIYLIILSPFFLRLRLQSYCVKKIIRFALFICFIYPLILPVHFMYKINGHICYSFFIFLVINSKVKYEHWALQMTLFYYILTLFPFILLASAKKYYKNCNSIFMINGILFIGLFIASMFINFLTVAQSITIRYLFFSTAYVYIFIILLILFIINLYK